MAIIARYGAIGSTASQFHVVHPPLVCSLVRTPLAIASRPAGTAMWYVNEALSRGWSLAGNQVAATCGSPWTIAPSSVGRNPRKPKPSWKIGSGTPSYRATTVKVEPFVSPLFGLTVSSWPLRFVFARNAVDGQRAEPQADEVEIERREVLRRPGA